MLRLGIRVIRTVIPIRMMSSANLSSIKTQAYINGKYVDADSGQSFDVLNPVNNEKICSVTEVRAEQVPSVIQTAYDTFKSWKRTSPKERSAILYRWYELIMKNQEELATLITLENGKTISDARGEVAYGASFVEWYAAEARRVSGDVVASPDARRIVTLKQPIGVVGIITPWNFPLAMLTRKVAPALAAGCTCVARPAEDTPLTAIALGQLASEAGIPAGAMNIIPSSRESAGPVGKVLCESELISCMSFTGSSHVGKILLSQSAGTVKRMCLELGGNAPFLVFDSANLDLTISCLMAAKFRCSGQTCVSPNRILVQSGIYDRFIEAAKKAMSSLTVGDGMDKSSSIGPLVNDKAVEKVHGLVEDAVKRGARLLMGGKVVQGRMYPPTLLCDVSAEMECAREEIFGPIVAVRRFETESEGIALANDCRVGLAGYLYTTDMSQAWRMSEEMEVGMVSVNTFSASSTEIPFGGVKESGLGRESAQYGIEEFLEVKSVAFGGI